MYGFMRVGDAARYYAALHVRWDAVQLADDLTRAGLGAELEVRRMKTVYQRVLVLALISAAQPAFLVIERAEQFDVPPAAELLDRVVRRAARAIVTYAPGAEPHAAPFDGVTSAAAAGLP